MLGLPGAFAQSGGCLPPMPTAGCQLDPGRKTGIAGATVKNDPPPKLSCRSGLTQVDDRCEGTEQVATGAESAVVISYVTPLFDSKADRFSIGWHCPDPNWTVNIRVLIGRNWAVDVPGVPCHTGEYRWIGEFTSNLGFDHGIYARVEAQDNICQKVPMLLNAKLTIPERLRKSLTGVTDKQRSLVVDFGELGSWKSTPPMLKPRTLPSLLRGR